MSTQEAESIQSKRGPAVPPYVPYRTMKTFVESLKIAMPSRIDRSVMPSMSGAVQSQLNAALKYLGLVSDKGLPAEALVKLANSEGLERQKALREIVKAGYSFLFVGFDLQRATTRQLEEEFGKVGAGGQTVRKCIAFFMAIAKDADIALSPHIKPFQGTSRSPRSRRTASGVNGSGNPDESGGQPLAEGNVSWSQLLLSKFPSFDPAWPDDVKTKWFDAFEKLMKQGQGGAS
jgi:hypothetical protein